MEFKRYNTGVQRRFKKIKKSQTNTDNFVIYAAFSRIKNKNNELQLVASTYYTNLFDLTSDLIRSRLALLNCKTLRVLFICDKDKYDTMVCGSLFKNNNGLDVSFQMLEWFPFLNGNLFERFFIRGAPELSETIFIFDGTAGWKEVVALFKSKSVQITGGSNTKRHILSPVHLRLGKFISCIEGMDSNMSYESFHLADQNTDKFKIHFTEKDKLSVDQESEN